MLLSRGSREESVFLPFQLLETTSIHGPCFVFRAADGCLGLSHIVSLGRSLLPCYSTYAALVNTVNPSGSSRISPLYKGSWVTSSISSAVLIPLATDRCVQGFRARPLLEEEYILFTIKVPVHTELVQLFKWPCSIPWTPPSHLFKGWAVISPSHAFVPVSMFSEQD